VLLTRLKDLPLIPQQEQEGKKEEGSQLDRHAVAAREGGRAAGQCSAAACWGGRRQSCFKVVLPPSWVGGEIHTATCCWLVGSLVGWRKEGRKEGRGKAAAAFYFLAFCCFCCKSSEVLRYAYAIFTADYRTFAVFMVQAKNALHEANVLFLGKLQSRCLLPAAAKQRD
jgi:hypothetical protein